MCCLLMMAIKLRLKSQPSLLVTSDGDPRPIIFKLSMEENKSDAKKQSDITEKEKVVGLLSQQSSATLFQSHDSFIADIKQNMDLCREVEKELTKRNQKFVAAKLLDPIEMNAFQLKHLQECQTILNLAAKKVMVKQPKDAPKTPSQSESAEALETIYFTNDVVKG